MRGARRKRGQDPFACRPGGCFAQKGPVPFSVTIVSCLALLAASVLVCGRADAAAADNGATNPYIGKTAGQVQNDELLKPGPDPGTSPFVPGAGAVVQMALWLAVIVVFIYGMVWLIRKCMPSARNMFAGSVMKVVARTYLSPKQYILLVKVGSKLVLVGVTNGSMTPLGEITDPEDVKRITEEIAGHGGTGGGIGASFRKMLGQARSDYPKDEPYSDRMMAESDVPEVGEVRHELDAIVKKMNWWRKTVTG
jgi:flagellar biosynthetic protein FliO